MPIKLYGVVCRIRKSLKVYDDRVLLFPVYLHSRAITLVLLNKERKDTGLFHYLQNVE